MLLLLPIAVIFYEILFDKMKLVFVAMSLSILYSAHEVFFCQSETLIGIINPLMSLLHDNVRHAHNTCMLYLSSILSVLTNGVN